MSENGTTNGNHNGEMMLNGVSVDQGILELLQAYSATAQHSDTGVPAEHPVIVRQRRIAKNASGLEEVVKEVLGESVKADKDKAEAIVRNLAYELAKTDGFSGAPEDLTDEKARLYLNQAGNALGNPTIASKLSLVESKSKL